MKGEHSKEFRSCRHEFMSRYKELADRFRKLARQAESNMTIVGDAFDDMHLTIYRAEQSLKACRAWMYGWERGDVKHVELAGVRNGMLMDAANLIDRVAKYAVCDFSRGNPFARKNKEDF